MEGIGEQVGGTINSMGWALIELIGLYMLLPVFGAAIILRLLRIKGQMHKILVGIVGLICLYFLMTKGIQGLPDKIQ